jgi:anti-sigma B factor antagonist
VELLVHRTDHEGWVVVSIGGELDLATGPTLRSELRRVAQDAPRVPVAVDLRGVGFIDSVGLGILIGARRRITEQGGRFAVVAEPGRIIDTIRLAGLAEVLTVVPSIEALAGA